jgi:hypothetical protein
MSETGTVSWSFGGRLRSAGCWTQSKEALRWCRSSVGG